MPKSFTVRDLPKTERPREILRQCSICGRKILVRIYPDDSYRGGHYFGKIPLHTDAEFDKARKAGTTRKNWGKTVVEILKKDPRPYKYAEYWECPKCYWHR